MDIAQLVYIFIEDFVVESYDLLSSEHHVIGIDFLFWCYDFITAFADMDTGTISNDKGWIVLGFF